MSLPETVWRLGFHTDPLGFPPPKKYGWNNRYDDPEKVYRSLYAAEDQYTCLLEVYADLRPDSKTLIELDDFPDGDDDQNDLRAAAGLLTAKHLGEKVLAPAKIVPSSASLPDLRDPALRETLKVQLATLLAALDISHLTLGIVLGEIRAVTQAVSRQLYDHGHDGVQFPSKHDDRPCFALFEGRGEFEPAGASEALSATHPLIVRICKDFGLHC